VGGRDRVVQNVEGADDLCLGVADQWIVDTGAAGEVRKDLFAVVGHGGHADALLLELLALALELREIRLAVDAPVGRARDKQHQAVGAAQRLEGLLLAVLVHAGEGRDLVAHVGPRAQLRWAGRCAQGHARQRQHHQAGCSKQGRSGHDGASW